jgi:Glycosyl transferase family 11
MIITELHGGLGNQLFQYASSKGIAHSNNTELKLDLVRFMHKTLPSNSSSEHLESKNQTSLKEGFLKPIFKAGSYFKKEFYSLYSTNHYKTDPKRVFELHNFNIESLPLTIIETLGLNLNAKLLNKYKFIKEKQDYVFDDSLFNQGSDLYLIGFWQSEKYFKSIESDIRKEFKVKVEPSNEDKKLIELINKTNSVSLHVRRGDYVASAVHSAMHGALSLEYYNNAITYIKSKVDNPHFFIFSDDPDWAKENIKTGTQVSVSYNPPEIPYADIRLMYNCKHNIIANSTYSWWGAWLGEYKNKIVVAPRKWVNDSTIDTKDAVPETWTRI